MPNFNPDNIKTPHELRRMVAFIDIDIEELSKLTGRSKSAINNYLSDDMDRSDYLFQFALEFLTEQKTEKIKRRWKTLIIITPNGKRSSIFENIYNET